MAVTITKSGHRMIGWTAESLRSEISALFAAVDHGPDGRGAHVVSVGVHETGSDFVVEVAYSSVPEGRSGTDRIGALAEHMTMLRLETIEEMTALWQSDLDEEVLAPRRRGER